MSARVDELLAQLSLDEKVSLLAGEDAWHLPAIERLGIGRLKMTDGPNGARGADWTAGPPSACFPCGSALAATFDTALLRQVGAHLAEEARAKGAHVLLGPTVNIHRHPLAGRHFECYSEDPELTAQLAVAYISGVQSGGVSACVKHFVANDSEFERLTISSEVPERALREIYLRPFEAAVTEAGSWSVMAAYNKVQGIFASEHPWLLRTVLREEWGFDGFVVSDWGATHTTAAAAVAGLDVEMPGPTNHRGTALTSAVRAGEVSEVVIDDLARAVLVVAERTGCLDVAVSADEGSADTEERRLVARRAAASAIVLLKNDAGPGGQPLLPLDLSAASIAVIGPNSDPARVQGGGSAGVTPYYEVTPLDGIRARAGAGVTIRHEPACEIARSVPHIDLRLLQSLDGGTGLTAEHYNGPVGKGAPVLTQVVRRIPGGWNQPPPGIDPDRWGLRLRGTLTVPRAGEHLLQVRTTGAVVVRLDGAEVAQAEVVVGRGARAECGIELEASRPHVFEIDIDVPPGSGFVAGFDIRHRPPTPPDAFERAVAAARDAEVAVVVVGTDNDWETEGRDRQSLELPGRQVELIRAVVAANPRTVVVLNTGAPVAMHWLADVPAALQLWFAGQETGNALADVLFGDVNPSGRLPTTIPRSLSDTPAFTTYPGEFGRVDYGEGLFVGYRWYEARGIAPALPFGHGLSYTSFAYAAMTATSVGLAEVEVTLDITNTGARAGAEVVQVYVAALAPNVVRPPKELKAFVRVELEPGETRTVTFRLGERAFAYWDPETHGWRVDPGEYDIAAGASSADVRATARVVVGRATRRPPA